MFSVPIIRSQSFSEPLPWGVNFTRVSQFLFFVFFFVFCFLFFSSQLDGTDWVEWAGVGYFPFAGS